MSRFDYEVSKALSQEDPPFAALIMAAMRKADSVNAFRLEVAWPEIIAELQERYNAPGGFLPGEAAPSDHYEAAAQYRATQDSSDG